MNAKEDIIRIFRDGDGKGAWEIKGLPDKYPAWVIRTKDSRGVAVPVSSYIEIDESFSNIRIQCDQYNFEGQPIQFYLTLLSPINQNENYDKYSAICFDFVNTTDGSERRKLTENPFAWWQEWKTLIGNVNKSREAHSVIAEMISLQHILEIGETVIWEGPSGGTVDIRGTTFDCEVKSSLSRYSDEIELSSELQLKKGVLPLHLYYCAFEKSESGTSIEMMVKRLVDLGMDEGTIEESLKEIGLNKGKASRLEKYHLLKFWDFKIDDDFPRIVPESFKGDSLPRGIKKIRYTVDLDGIDHTNMDTNL